MAHILLKNDGSRTVTYTFSGIDYVYDITKLNSGYSVQVSSGDEEYYETTDECEYAIRRDLAYILWDGHPEPIGKMWNDKDLDTMISFINARPDRKEWFLNYTVLGISKSDFNAIKSVLNEGYAEYFDHYDSAVAEHFIRACENIILDYFS